MSGAGRRYLAMLGRETTAARFARFVIVGAINTGVGYLAFALLLLAGLLPQPALALSFALGVLWNYWAHGRFVFASGGLRKLPAYVVAYLLIYAFNAGSLHALLAAGIHPLLAQALLLPLVAVLSFVAIGRILGVRSDS